MLWASFSFGCPFNVPDMYQYECYGCGVLVHQSVRSFVPTLHQPEDFSQCLLCLSFMLYFDCVVCTAVKKCWRSASCVPTLPSKTKRHKNEQNIPINLIKPDNIASIRCFVAIEYCIQQMCELVTASLKVHTESIQSHCTAPGTRCKPL